MKKITINEIDEVLTENKHQIYEIDQELYYIDKDSGSIFHIDFEKIDETTGKTSDDDTNQDELDTQDTHSKEEGTEEGESESEEEEDDKENPEEYLDKKKSDMIDSDPILTKIKNAIKNKKLEKGGCDMDFEMKETSETKPDGAESMKERRITQCMEESGQSRKICTEKVRKEMHKTGAEAVNPEDMEKPAEEPTKEEPIEKETEDTEDVKDTKDTVEICQKELDFLKEQAEELKTLKTEKEKTENDFKSLKADFLVYKKKIDDKEATEKEVNRQKVIKRISHDFDIPEEEMKDDTIEEIEKLEKRLEMALKRDTEDEEIETFGDEEDFKEIGDKIHNRYFLEV